MQAYGSIPRLVFQGQNFENRAGFYD